MELAWTHMTHFSVFLCMMASYFLAADQNFYSWWETATKRILLWRGTKLTLTGLKFRDHDEALGLVQCEWISTLWLTTRIWRLGSMWEYVDPRMKFRVGVREEQFPQELCGSVFWTEYLGLGKYFAGTEGLSLGWEPCERRWACTGQGDEQKELECSCEIICGRVFSSRSFLLGSGGCHS